MYTCGPTVYRDAHVGNLRSYLMADWIRRVLEVQDIEVTHVKNITDVGHMRQEMLERGEDKVIATALAEGKTPAEIAQFYTGRFEEDERKLNIKRPQHLPKATDHIPEMVSIVEVLIEKGYAAEVEGNVYYQVSRFPGYGRLSGNTYEGQLLEGVRAEPDPLKEDQRDFTLWKRAESGRELKWASPWGEGFPGWHIECSAMSIKYLGEQFDIHTGGVDNIFPHHEDEIAQSEGFTGKPVVRHWVHGQHLLADGVKMAKSSGNSFVVPDIEALGIDPLAFRYLCMTARYTSRLNFTFSALKAAQRALLRLQNRVWQWETAASQSDSSPESDEEWHSRFLECVNDNLDLPAALALTWEMARSDLPSHRKLSMVRRYEEVLGLGLSGVAEAYRVPADMLSLSREREELRRKGDYDGADGLRHAINQAGYVIEDTPSGPRVRPQTAWERQQERWRTVSSPAEVDSLIDASDEVELSIGVVAGEYVDDVVRCVESAVRWIGDRPCEVVVVDNGHLDSVGKRLEQMASEDSRTHIIHTDHVLGEAAAKNIVLKQCRGETVIMLDTSVEVVGDIFGPIDDMLDDDRTGMAGPFGLRSADLHHFHDGEGEAGKMDAMQAYCFAFKRERLRDVGLMRESFRFYRNLDLDYSFQFKDKGYDIVSDPELQVIRHTHRAWSDLGEQEREELSRKNYGRFLDRWGGRLDLLVVNGTGE